MSNARERKPATGGNIEVLTSTERLEQMIRRVADGEAIDWQSLAPLAADPATHGRLELLRLLEEMGALHLDADARGAALPAASETDASAALWGGYVLHDVIGEGSFGRVYRAWDPQLKMPVAIKILHRPQQELLIEAEALGQIRHPNVVRVLCVATHEGRAGLCMECIDGETLEEYVERHGRLSPREATVIAEDLCGALAAIHRAGFVHRDVKARNVMRENAGRIVLMDLGARRSLVVSNDAETERNVGTPYYMAPEVLNGERAAKSSDIYSLGVLVFFLLTRRYPVEGGTVSELQAAHAGRKRHLLADLRPDVSPAFARVIDRVLSADPDQRYQTAAAFLDALRVDSKSDGLPQRLARAASAIGLVVIALAGMGLLSSAAFNVTLDRSDFSSESFLSWLVLGLRASVLPTVFFAIALFIMAIIAALRMMLVKIAAIASFEARCRRALERIGLTDPSVVAFVVLALSVASLVGASSYFAPLLDAVTSKASTAPAESLSFLSPDYIPYHEEFRTTLTRLVILAAGGWYVVAKLCARRQATLHVGIKLGGLATMLLLVGTLQLPYKLIFQSQFPMYRWHDQGCYATGERGDSLLLFCPESAPPRNQIVTRGASGLVATGRRESIFSRFGRGETVRSQPAER